MCSTPTPIHNLSNSIVSHILNKEFDSVKEKIDRFRKKGYLIHYAKISRREYESEHFNEYARTIMQKAKKLSNEYCYNGVLVFFPCINKNNYPELFNHEDPSIFFKSWITLFEFSKRFNKNMCLGNVVINNTNKICEDTNIYLMIFYFKGGLNWK